MEDEPPPLPAPLILPAVDAALPLQPKKSRVEEGSAAVVMPARRECVAVCCSWGRAAAPTIGGFYKCICAPW